jgi:hypothetical protein
VTARLLSPRKILIASPTHCNLPLGLVFGFESTDWITARNSRSIALTWQPEPTSSV